MILGVVLIDIWRPPVSESRASNGWVAGYYKRQPRKIFITKIIEGYAYAQAFHFSLGDFWEEKK